MIRRRHARIASRPCQNDSADLPELMIAGYRSDGLPRDHMLRRLRRELRRSGRLDELTLAPLTPSETTELLAQLLNDTPVPSLANAIHRRTQGLPFFIEVRARERLDRTRGRRGGRGRAEPGSRASGGSQGVCRPRSRLRARRDHRARDPGFRTRAPGAPFKRIRRIEFGVLLQRPSAARSVASNSATPSTGARAAHETPASGGKRTSPERGRGLLSSEFPQAVTADTPDSIGQPSRPGTLGEARRTRAGLSELSHPARLASLEGHEFA